MTHGDRLDRIAEIVRNATNLDDQRDEILGLANWNGTDRVDYVRQNYIICPFTNRIMSRHTNDAVAPGAKVHTGQGRSPVHQARARWFLLHGTDPKRVWLDDRGEVRASAE